MVRWLLPILPNGIERVGYPTLSMPLFKVDCMSSRIINLCTIVMEIQTHLGKNDPSIMSAMNAIAAMASVIDRGHGVIFKGGGLLHQANNTDYVRAVTMVERIYDDHIRMLLLAGKTVGQIVEMTGASPARVRRLARAIPTQSRAKKQRADSNE